MSATSLILLPSGHADIGTSKAGAAASPAAAIAANPANATGSDSTFAGALQNASPRPARKPAAGNPLPTAGTQAPPVAVPLPVAAAVPQAGVPAAPVAPPLAAAVVAVPVAPAKPASSKDDVLTGVVPSAAQPAVTAFVGPANATRVATTIDHLPGNAGNGAAVPTVEAAAASVAAATASVSVIPPTPAAGVQTPSAAGAIAAAPSLVAQSNVKIPLAAVRITTAAHAPGSSPSSISGRDADVDSASAPAPAAPPAGAPAQATFPDVAATAAAAIQAANPAALQGDTDGAAEDAGEPIVAGAAAPTAAAPTAAASAATALAASRAVTVLSAQNALTLASSNDDAKRSRSAADQTTTSAGGGDAAAGALQLGSNSSVGTSADTAATPTLQVHANVDSGEFAQGLLDRVAYMVDNGLNGAKLQVNPPQLGPIELRIAVTAGHAQVWMTTHSAVTRDALESSSPKLKEMLGAQGFGQVSVDISQRSFQERSTHTQPYERLPSAGGSSTSPAVASVARSTPRSSLGALDTYA